MFLDASDVSGEMQYYIKEHGNLRLIDSLEAKQQYPELLLAYLEKNLNF